MTWIDHLFALALLVGIPAYAAWDVPRLARRVELDPETARTNDYLLTMVLQWGLTLALIGWWWRASRRVGELGLVWPEARGWWWTLIISTAAIVFFASQAYSVATSAAAQAKVLKQLTSQPSVRVILPDNDRELRVFGALAVTAGICEEVLYRGYLLWYLQSLRPGAAAIVLAIAAFGVAHAYQGLRGIALTSAAGAAVMGLYLLTGSLVAPIVLHATVDLANGFMAYQALQKTGGPEAAASLRQDSTTY